MASGNSGNDEGQDRSKEAVSEKPSSSPGKEPRLRSDRFGSAISSRSFSASTNPTIKFGLNRTFLDVHDSDYEPPQKPRASSDPGTEFSSESMSEEHSEASKFRQQQDMVLLSNHMHQIWRDRCSDSGSAADVSDSASDSMRAQSQQDRFSSRWWDLKDLKEPSTTEASSCPDEAVATVDTDQCLASLGPAGATAVLSHDQHMAAVRRQLQHRKLEGRYGNRRSKPLSPALAVIAEIPEQVREFLEQTANNLVSDLEEQLQEMRTVIRANENASNASEAVGKLDAIPGIIFHSFEESFACANNMVQIKVDGVIAQLGDGDGKDELAFQASAIPEEVARIAETEFAMALQDVRQRAAAGIDAALRAAPAAAASAPMDLGRCKRSIVATQQGQQLASAQLQTKTKLAVNEAISIAPSAVLGSDHSAPASAGASSSTRLLLSRQNAGSFGHPELCPRPCLYFARGECSKGADCEYCHLEHGKRPSHLDKRNRETLNAARFEEVLMLSTPLLREKVKKLGLNPDVLQVLDAIDDQLTAGTDRVRIRRTRALQKLGNALGSLSLRSLLTTLQRIKDDRGLPEQAKLEAYVTRIRTLVMPSIFENSNDDHPDLDEM